MNISKDKLKLYLNNRKKFIELKKYSGLSEIISGASMLLTLICADFESTILENNIVKTILIIISFAILLYGGYFFIFSLRNNYSIDTCFNEICELEEEKSHVQNIILLQNNHQEGRYLLVYNPNWKCYLFPSYYGISQPYLEEEEMNNFVSRFADF